MVIRPKSHNLKTDTVVFDAVWRGAKLFEYRLNDREFQVDDWLTLEEVADKVKTGRQIICTVSFILRGPDFGVPLGFCVMSLDPKSMRMLTP